MGNLFFRLKNNLPAVIAIVLIVVIGAGGIYILTSKSSPATSTSSTLGGTATTVAGHPISTTTTAVPALNPTGACLTAVNNMKAFIAANPASKGSPSGVELSQYQPIYQKVLQNCSATQSDAVIGHVIQPWLTAAAKVSAGATTTSTPLTTETSVASSNSNG